MDFFSCFVFGFAVGTLFAWMLQRPAVNYYRMALDLEIRKARRYEAMFPDYVRDAVERRVMEEVHRGE